MPTVTPMETLLTNITSVMTSATSWFGSVSSALVGNEVFQIVLAIVLLLTLATFLVNLVGKIRNRQRTSR